MLISVSSNIISEAVITLSLTKEKETSNSSQQSQSTSLSDSKKQLKKQLSLDYTHPKFETEITQTQKDAILKTLKKWKGELPVNNTFTITSWANLKSDTLDSIKQSKKKNSKTPNAFVVYMWASTPNLNWDMNKPFDEHDYEAGDPRFIRTEFNVLLRQEKNNWKASIERDVEVKNESEAIIETPEDVKIMQDLFQTNKLDNGLTSINEVLVESSSSILSSSSISSNSNTLSILSSSTSSTSVSSSLIPIISTNNSSLSSENIPQVTPKSSSSSSNTLSLLDVLFGSISVSAGENDYSWPWKSGETWTVGSKGWHPGDFTGFDGGTNINNALDVLVPDSYKEKNQYNQWTGKFYNTQVLSPKKGTMQRICVGTNNSSVVIDKIRIVHLANNGFASKDGVSVNKNEFLSNVALGPNNNGIFGDSCGYSDYPHLHLKFMLNNMVIDTSTVTHGISYTSFTSQNQSNTNNYSGFIKANSNNQLVFDIVDSNSNDQAPIKLAQGKWSGGSENQRWGYIPSTKEIKGMNNKCLDAGNVYDSNNRWLRMSSCHGGNNQKWERDSSGRVHSLENYNICMDSYGGSVNNGTTVAVWDCHGGEGQKWNVADLNMPLPSSTYNKYMFKRTGTTQCLDMYSPYNGSQVDTWTCNPSDNDQIFEAIPGQNGSFAYRRIGTNKCVDAYGPYNGRVVYAWDCDYNASNHNWYYNWSSKMFQQRGTSQCLAKYGPSSGSQINTWSCNNSDGNLMWDAVQVH